ncbi:DUF87 domain-containing protein [Moorella naiadis]|uniref:helicase HerA domain-containing protein n=1 Tax=Moorella naiadis (nom. illeg.) TaxID=3093670 RepID=UPI003D9CAE56
MPGLFLRISDNFSIALTDYVKTGFRAGIWASSGRGKSYAMGVMAEEFLEAGFPVVIIDPEGEFWTFREKYRTLIIGGPHGDIPHTNSRDAVREILKAGIAQKLALIFDLSDSVSNASQQKLALPVLEELFLLTTKEKRNVGLFIEEVQIFAPQSTPAATSEIMSRIAKQGRKRGILLVVASQRTQAVSKEFMSQLNFPIIGGFEEKLDYEAVKHHAGGKNFDDLYNLPVGTFWFPRLGNCYPIRRRKVTHGGDTPAIGGEVQLSKTVKDSKLNTVIEKLAEIVAKATKAEEEERSEINQLKHRIKELEALLAAKDREIEQLQIALKAEAARASTQLLVAREMNSLSVNASHVEVRAPVENGPQKETEPTPEPALNAGDKLSADGLLEQPAVKKLLQKARFFTVKKLGGYGDYCDSALVALVTGSQVTPEDLALSRGLGSAQSVYRLRTALRFLVRVGLAKEEAGIFKLDVEKIQKAVGLYYVNSAPF